MACPDGCTKHLYHRDPAIGAKISAAKMGHSVSPEARKKIGDATRGRKASEATKAKMRERVVHGHGGQRRCGTRTPEYNAWDAMKQRCLNPNAQRYGDYGGRGITVCDRWLKFENFLADMGLKPEPKAQYSLDRVDNDGPYDPGNCRWSTRSEQQKNRPRFNPNKRGSDVRPDLGRC